MHAEFHIAENAAEGTVTACGHPALGCICKVGPLIPEISISQDETDA